MPTDASYKNYGGRGIKVAPIWRDDRDEFIQWAMANGHGAGLTLDRIDSNGDYAPDNCRWVTWKVQANNQRRNRTIQYGGVTMTATQWAEQLGILPDTLLHRINNGVPLDRALVGKSIKPTWRHGTRQGYEGHSCRCDECRNNHAIRGRESRRRRKLKKEDI